MNRMLFFIMICMIVVLVPTNATANIKSPNLQALEACKREFKKNHTYKSVDNWQIIYEHQDKTNYFLRTNIDIVTHNMPNQSSTIGLDCTVPHDLTYTHIGTYIELEPFQEEKTPQINHGEHIMRVKWTGSACPYLNHWKKFSDEMKKGNYMYNKPKSCFVVKRHTLISGPIKTETYNNKDYVYVRMSNGKKYWMESGAVNLPGKN